MRVDFLSGRYSPSFAGHCIRRVASMEDYGRIVIFTTPSKSDGVRRHIEQTVESKGKHLDLLLKQLPSLDDAVHLLDSGSGDLIAMSPEEWEKIRDNRFALVGILPRREPTWVLVSDDNPDRLIKEPLIVCDSELMARQFRRVRPDATLRQSETVIDDSGLEERELWMSIEQLRIEGKIDGYIVPRSLYSMLNIRSRRHTLGLQREQPRGLRERFIPPPMHGFTLLVGRLGFPPEEVESLCDHSAMVAYDVEDMLMKNLPEKYSGLTGIFVEQRKLGSLMNESKKNNDGFFEKFYVDTENKPIRSGPQIEVFMESLDHQGRVAFGCYKVIELEAMRLGTINILREFESIGLQLSTDFEELKRAPETLPEEYKYAREKLFKLHENENRESNLDEK
jgi:hypothetical protein